MEIQMISRENDRKGHPETKEKSRLNCISVEAGAISDFAQYYPS
jgi:hypothetical protein